MNILFTICGRAGSKGFKNKNLKILAGKPLVFYTLSVIGLYIKAHPEHEVTVALNTDSKDLRELIKNQNIVENIQCVERVPELANDTAPKVAVIKDTYRQCKRQKFFDVVVDLDITSPMRRLSDVEKAINTLCERRDYDVVFSVVPSRRIPYFNMVEKKDGYYHKVCESNYTTRQQAPEVFELNASIYAYNPQFIEGEIDKTLLEYKCGIVQMPDYLVLDIDSEEDYILMEEIVHIFVKYDEELRRIME